MASVHTSNDFGQTWELTVVNPVKILVIRPGAGTEQNRIVYDTLRHHGYEVEFLGLRIDQGYPDDWDDNDRLVLRRPLKTALQRANLLELAGKFPEIVGSEPPALVICGSRGCQVTVGLVWRHFWRGPTVLINAGCLTGTTTTIPREVFPVLIPCGRDDLFRHDRHGGIQNLINAFATFSKSDGILLYLTNQGHMPHDLHQIIVRVVQLALQRETDDRAWTTQLTESWCRVQNLDARSSPQAVSTPPQFIAANTKTDHTLLRREPRRSSAWGARVENGTPLEILESGTSDNGYPIYRVRTPSGEEGYIYAMNVQ